MASVPSERALPIPAKAHQVHLRGLILQNGAAFIEIFDGVEPTT